LVVVVVAAVFAAWLPLPDPAKLDYENIRGAPSLAHLLGGDALGRDMLSRVIFGARTSLLVGLSSVLIGAIIGSVIGLVAGFLRGTIDYVIVILTDVILAFPGLVLVIGVVAIFGASLTKLILALAFLAIPYFIRLARANTIAIAGREFVVAARAYGMKRTRIMAREIAPNVVLPVAAYGFILVGLFIVVEGSLSFLGLGVQPPTPDWGAMIAEGRTDIFLDPGESLIPAGVMFLTVLSINYLGERVRERTEVKDSAL
jgi:peptide/nickel transport system permease protein